VVKDIRSLLLDERRGAPVNTLRLLTSIFAMCPGCSWMQTEYTERSRLRRYQAHDHGKHADSKNNIVNNISYLPNTIRTPLHSGLHAMELSRISTLDLSAQSVFVRLAPWAGHESGEFLRTITVDVMRYERLFGGV
jgi:hypothetical protein